MSNTKPQTTTTTKKASLTEEQLKRMASTPCKNMLENGKCHYGVRCFFNHDTVGGRAVAFDSQSHQKLPPKKPAPPPLTENDIIRRVLETPGIGRFPLNFLNQFQTLDMVRSLVIFHCGITSLLNRLCETNFNDTVRQIFSSFAQYGESEPTTVLTKIELSLVSKPETRQQLLAQLNDGFHIPDEVHRILTAFDSHASSYAGVLSSDLVEIAKRNPDAKVSSDFLEHLAKACGLSENKGFREMLDVHKQLGSSSPYTNQNFVSLLELHDLNKQTEVLLSAMKEQEAKLDLENKVKQSLLSISSGKVNCMLKLSFCLVSKQEEFLNFAEGLPHNERQTLNMVFSPFLFFLSTVYEKSKEEITSEFLMKTFHSYCRSRRVDQGTIQFKDEFYKLAQTSQFGELMKIFQMQTSSYYQKQQADIPRVYMKIHEIFKTMMKELLSIYDDKVLPEDRDEFRRNLVTHLLPFVFLISLSPRNSDMLAGKWKKGELVKGTTELVNGYLTMQASSKKSILYWIVNLLNVGRKCDSFESLSAQFTEQYEVVNENGFKETKTKFIPDRLFDVLDKILKRNFLTSTEFPIKLGNIKEISLGKLFKIEDESISIEDTFPDVFRQALYLAFGASEGDVMTRGFSDVKACLMVSPNFIIDMVDRFQNVDHSNLNASVDHIIEGLDIETPSKSLKTSISSFVDLMHKNDSEDLLRKTYDVMSLGATLVSITKNHDFFLSILDSFIMVLLREKYPNVKPFEILNAIYVEKANRKQLSFIFVKNHTERLSDADNTKQSLLSLLSEEMVFNKTQTDSMKENLKGLSDLLCKQNLSEHSPHEQLKRLLPFLLNQSSLSSLLATVPKFEFDGSSNESNDLMSLFGLVQKFFKKEFNSFISEQNSMIQRDLGARMREIKETPSLLDKLRMYSFTKHVSSIVNIMNRTFESLGLSHKLEYDSFLGGFPRTKGLDSSESAKLVCNYVLNQIGVSKPETPEFMKDTEDKKLSAEEKEKQARIFHLQDQKFNRYYELFVNVIAAVYRVEVPKELVIAKKLPTIKLPMVKTELLKSESLSGVFETCLPYWKSDLVQELILLVLSHRYSSGDGCLRDLYSKVENYGVIFGENVKSQFSGMFEFLSNLEIPLIKKEDYEISDVSICELIRETLMSAFWDEDKDVEVSKLVVQTKPRIRRVACAQAEPDAEPEKELVDKKELIRLLENNRKEAIEYMHSCRLEKEEEIVFLQHLIDNEESLTMDEIHEAFIEVYGEIEI